MPSELNFDFIEMVCVNMKAYIHVHTGTHKQYKIQGISIN